MKIDRLSLGRPAVRKATIYKSFLIREAHFIAQISQFSFGRHWDERREMRYNLRVAMYKLKYCIAFFESFMFALFFIRQLF